MKKILTTLAIVTLIVGCEQPSTTLSDMSDDYNTLIIENCEYWLSDNEIQFSHKGNCPNHIPQSDTVYIYGVSMRYGTRDTVFHMYPIDSAEVAVGFLKGANDYDYE